MEKIDTEQFQTDVRQTDYFRGRRRHTHMDIPRFERTHYANLFRALYLRERFCPRSHLRRILSRIKITSQTG